MLPGPQGTARRRNVQPERLQHTETSRARKAGGGDELDHERSQFVWVISYEGDETFEEANERYWDSPERKELGLDPKEYLVDRDVQVAAQVH